MNRSRQVTPGGAVLPDIPLYMSITLPGIKGRVFLSRSFQDSPSPLVRKNFNSFILDDQTWPYRDGTLLTDHYRNNFRSVNIKNETILVQAVSAINEACSFNGQEIKTLV